MANKLKEATYLTIKHLKKQSIILPGKYSDIFEYHAKKLKLDIEDENIILKSLQEDERHIENIVKKTNENLTVLQETTTDARKAIKDKDDESLRGINDKLLVMQNQIELLQKELFSDPLTGAYNRKWLSDNYLDDDKFQNDGLIAFIDLNKFKFINDNYGHIIGDQVLKYLVKFLEQELKYPGVTVLRYAGDEFIVLFNTNESVKINFSERMKEVQSKLANLLLRSAKGKELKVSFSYGLVPFKKGEGFAPVLESVDGFMYANKEEQEQLIKS